jgi:hypothetical protein
MIEITDEDITVESVDIAPVLDDSIKLIIDGFATDGSEICREIVLTLKHARLLSELLPEGDVIGVELRAYLGQPGRAPD